MGKVSFFIYYSCCFAAVHVAQMHRYCTDDGGRFAVLQLKIFVFNSSIHYMCLIKDNLITVGARGLFIKRDMLKKMAVMLMQPFFC